jgi:SET family sugar efflux transporter-like MFS transporter
VTAENTSSASRRVTHLLGANAFFSGVSFAATVNYASIVGIDVLGIPNALYSVLLVVSSIVGAVTSVILGYASDRVRDRRYLVIACALAGALGFGLIYVFRSPLVFIVSSCVIMPFGFAVFSQSFAYTRAYYNRAAPARAEFMNSVMRTLFSMAWAVVPPAVGWLAAASNVFDVYAIAAIACLLCAAIFLALSRQEEGASPPPTAGKEALSSNTPRSGIDYAILVGILGIFLIFTGIQINNVNMPLLVTSTLGASYAELGILSGIAAAIELPFMILWGYSLRWVSKHNVIVIAALIYALYLFLLSRVTSVSEAYWLQPFNAIAISALLSIPISYMQDAIRNRVGLSTSLLDVVRVTSVIASASLFAWLTSARPDYALMFMLAAVLAVTGAAVLFAAHRLLPGRTSS